MKQCVIIFLLTVSFLFTANSQSRWVHQYLENYNAAGRNIQIAYDNGGVILDGNTDPLVMKLNVCGGRNSQIVKGSAKFMIVR